MLEPETMIARVFVVPGLPGLLAALPLLAGATPLTLSLVETQADNQVTIGVSVPAIGSDEDISTLTGTVQAEITVDPATDRVSELTFLSADVNGSPIALRAAALFNIASFSLTSTVIGGNLTTPVPPGLVTPETGVFDSSQHYFEINEGSISGNVNVLGTNNPVNVNFSTEPVGAFGSNPGGVWAVPTAATPASKTYTVVVIMPLEITEVQTIQGQEVTITATGILNASGEVTVPIGTPYEQWTVANAIAGAPFTGDHDLDGVTNGLLWGLGLQAGDDPSPNLPVVSGTTAQLVLPAGGSAADLWIETSTSLAPDSWVNLRAEALSTGTNPLPAGTAGPVTINLPPGDRVRGLRLRVVAP